MMSITGFACVKKLRIARTSPVRPELQPVLAEGHPKSVEPRPPAGSAD
jgi:hypothetical protein